MFYKKSFLVVILFSALILSGCSLQLGGGGFGFTTSGKDGGVWFSKDSGVSWEQKVNFPLANDKKSSIGGVAVRRMAFDPTNTKTIYLSTEKNGIIYTKDGGENWQQFSQLKSGFVRAVAVDAKDHCTIYAVAENNLLKTADCGEHWQIVYYHPNAEVILTDVVVDHYDHAVVYVATSAGEIVKSKNGGQTWLNIYKADGVFIDLEMSPKDSRIIYAATIKNGIFRTKDAGANWESLKDSLKEYRGSQEYKQLIIAPANSHLFLISAYGILESGDSGVSWSPVGLFSDSDAAVYAAAVNPKNSKEIFYTTKTALLKSTDGGKTWSSSRLSSSKAVSSILIDPQDPKNIFLGMMPPLK